VAGWVAGPDGVFGMPGELVEREGPYLARVALSGFLQGASAAFAAAQTTTSIGALGNTTTSITGNEALYGALSGFANTAHRMAAFYERQLESLVPAVYAPSGLGGSAVIQGGVTLDGVTADQILAQRGHLPWPDSTDRSPPRWRPRRQCVHRAHPRAALPLPGRGLAAGPAADRPSLAEWILAGLQGPGTFGIWHPTVPVVVPPDIRRVWVPTHENPDGELVAGH
jgi:hypothetical protein